MHWMLWKLRTIAEQLYHSSAARGRSLPEQNVGTFHRMALPFQLHFLLDVPWFRNPEQMSLLTALCTHSSCTGIQLGKKHLFCNLQHFHSISERHWVIAKLAESAPLDPDVATSNAETTPHSPGHVRKRMARTMDRTTRGYAAFTGTALPHRQRLRPDICQVGSGTHQARCSNTHVTRSHWCVHTRNVQHLGHNHPAMCQPQRRLASITAPFNG